MTLSQPSSAPPTPPRPPRALLRRLLLALAAGLALLIVAVLSLRLPPVGNAVANLVLGRLPLVPGARLSVAGTRGDWLTHLELRGLRLAGGGITYAVADTLRLHHDLWPLLVGRIQVRSVDVAHVVLDPRLFRVPRPPPRKPRPPLTLDDVLDGRFYAGPPLAVGRASLRDVRGSGTARGASLLEGVADSTVRLLGVRLEARDLELGRGFAFVLDSLGLQLRAARVERADVSTRVRASLRDGRLELRELRLHSPTSDVRARGVLAPTTAGGPTDVGLHVDATPLDLADLSAFFAAPDTGAGSFAGLLKLQAALEGASLDSLSGTLRAELERGRVAGLGLAPLRLDAPLERGLARVALEAVAEDAPLSLRGWIRPLDAVPTFQFRLAAPRLPARLPWVPGWAAFAHRVPCAVDVAVRARGYADVVGDIEGAARDDSSSIEWRAGVDLSRGAAWELSRLALRDVDVARIAGASTSSRVNGELRARGERDSRGRLRARANLALGPSSYGLRRFESGQALLSLDERSGGASLRLVASGGTLDMDTLMWRWSAGSPFQMRGARLRVHDLAAWTGDPSLPGRLEADAELEGSGGAHLGSANGGVRALRDGRVRARGRLTLAPSAFRGRDVRGARLELGLSEGDVTLQGTLDSDAGRLAVHAVSRPFDERPVHQLRRLRFDELDLGAWLGHARLRSRLAGTLTGEARGGPPEWNAALELEGERVGPLAFGRGALRADGRGPQSRANGSLEVKGGSILFEADMHEAGEASAAAARLHLPMKLLPSLLGRDTLEAEGALALTLDATGPLRDPRAIVVTGEARGSGTVESARLDSLRVAFRLERGLVTVDTLELRSNVAAARGSGQLVLVDPPSGGTREAIGKLHVEAEWRDPSRLAPLLGADTLSVGSGGTVLDVSGPASDRSFTLRSDLRTLVWDRVRVKRAAAEVRGRLRSRQRLTELAASVSADWMTLGDLRVPSARVHVQGDSIELRWNGSATLRERDSLTLAGAFRPDSAGWALALEHMELRSDSARWHLAGATQLQVRGPRLELQPLEVRSAQGRITARGVLDRAGTQDFHAELRDVGLGTITSLQNLGDLDGRWSARLDVTGPASAPRANGDVRATFEARERLVGALGADFDWTHEGVVLMGAFSSPERDSLVLTGHVPLLFSLSSREPGTPAPPRFGAGPTELRLRAGRFPLGALQPMLASAGVGAVSGTLDTDLRLSGRGSEFRGEGGATIADGRLELPGLGLKASGLRLDASWQGDRLMLRELHSLAGKGKLDASGSIRVASLTRAEPDLRVKADRAVLVDTKQLKLVASGDLRVGGTVTQPALRGRLSFGGSHLLVAPETFSDPKATAPIPLSAEDLKTLEETFTYVEVVAPNPVLALYDASDLDLTIVLDRNNWIRQTAEPRLSVEVFGEVRMRKPPGGEPDLVGRLEPLPGRGYLEQFGRSFALTGGEVLLNGPMSAHTLDLRAQYPSERDAMSREENDVVVHLDLQGTLEKMRLVLSSEPALSETEIITFIATGRSPTTRTGSSQSLGSDAVQLGVDMGMAAVSGVLEDAAQKSVGLDVLKVGYDGIQGSTLIAGRYVAPQLYVGFRQPLQTLNNSGTTLDEDTDTKVELEYAAYRWLVLNVQGESSFIRSYLRFRREY